MPRSPLWAHSLSRKAAFARVRRRGRRHRLGRATLHLLPRSAGPARMGVVIPRKVGSAVRRNFLRRRLRAWAWGRLPTAGPADGVLVVHQDPGPGLGRLVEELDKAWTR